ncbi:MAG: sigma-70 family RNA polymerase sigma factor [Rhodospirillales bacterium]|nr:sigma-70 family RNA polymerase sigma factor [Rhodospirillales bacterium]
MTHRDQLWKHQISIRITDHIGFLENYARSLTTTHDQADDLVQDSLVRALRNIDKFEDGTNLRAWLTTIVRNLHIDGARRRQRRPDTIPIDDWLNETSMPANQLHNLSLRDVRRRLKRLRPAEASALRLVVADGHSYEQAADMLHVATGTVKSRLSRARDKLRAA